MVFFHIWCNLKEKGLYILLKHCKLINQGRIKHNIRLLLERKDVAFLSPADRIPHGNCPCRCRTSRPCITDNPPDQSPICRRNPVVLIYIELGEGTDINLKLPVIRKGFGKLRIETMDTFDHENIPTLHLQLSAVIFPLSGNEIKSWNLHLFSQKQTS